MGVGIAAVTWPEFTLSRSVVNIVHKDSRPGTTGICHAGSGIVSIVTQRRVTGILQYRCMYRMEGMAACAADITQWSFEETGEFQGLYRYRRVG